MKKWEGAGIIHCFSYTKEMARQFLDLGYYISYYSGRACEGTIGGVRFYPYNCEKIILLQRGHHRKPCNLYVSSAEGIQVETQI